MTASIFLVCAILCEVAATMSLRAAVTGTRRWYAVVVIGYLVSFVFLSLTLAHGMPLGVAYGIWSATGVALIAVLSKFIFREPLTLMMGAGIALIIGGVLLVETGSTH
ncbi:multidrug efflux SMR transporter [Gordonia sp. Z-3]|uniref:Multidrug efflux SMR transporter n=1 Tax=Gordonia aquimaris TaxID=2984863 RepID=A0A9X3D2T4_9ACTN|nr:MULTISPECIES: multidrug efflux SMR transporter [Gordonia]MCX2963529.1 multidrug efflux SMR transporter [Gordonia aquimaris]MED5803279.1 multidrug efflux SMR transporter [Gordonia sp. Z-3]